MPDKRPAQYWTTAVLPTLLLLCSVVVLLTACGQGADPSPTPTADDPTPTSTIEVYVTKTEPDPKRSIIDTEGFPLPNCGGTGDLTQSLGTRATVKKGLMLGAKASVSTGGEVSVPEIVKLQLEIEVELAYQHTFEQANDRLDTIQMQAAPGTYVVYAIQWEEQRFVSKVTYSFGGIEHTVPYTYTLGIPKISDSYQVDCPTLTPSCTPAFTSTPSPLPATPTSTPKPEPTDAPTPAPTSSYTPKPPVIPSTLPTSTPEPRSASPAPTLLEPTDGETLSGGATFRWKWDHEPLQGNLAFDLRIWSRQEKEQEEQAQEEQYGQIRRGAISPTQNTQVDVDLQFVPAIVQYEQEEYYWTVVVVELRSEGPPEVVGRWGETRMFAYRSETRSTPTPVATPTRIQPKPAGNPFQVTFMFAQVL